jgi:hypothetical protein
MLELTFPETSSRELILEPKEIKKGFASATPRSRVNLGEPGVLAIRKDAAETDPDLKQFIEQQSKQWNFYAVQLGCSFATGNGEEFEQAFVQVNLSLEGPAGTDSPIAWSMRPLKLSEKTEVTDKVALGAELKFLKPSVSREVKGSREAVFLQAYNEMRADPYWRLKGNAGMVIEGAQRLHMVVRVPRSLQARGVVNVEVDIKRSKFGLISYNTRLPDVARAAFLMKV